MGAKPSSDGPLSTPAKEASLQQLTTPHSAAAADRSSRGSLKFPKFEIVIGSLHRNKLAMRKLKGKRNVSATFNISELEGGNNNNVASSNSEHADAQSCVSNQSSSQNFFSSTSSMNNSVADSDSSGLLLNINTATEEALMTLPGVNRATARNIVSYRKLIGGFKHIQDVALVSGVGATLFVRFRSDVTCFGLPPEVVAEQQQQQPLEATKTTTTTTTKSTTLSKHSSTSSSGIDISTINEDDDVCCDDRRNNNNNSDKCHHGNHHHHSSSSNNNNAIPADNKITFE